jgi:hypothetical protein
MMLDIEGALEGSIIDDSSLSIEDASSSLPG